MQPSVLTHYLTATSFKQLTAMLATYHLPRAAKDTKADVIEQLQQFLTNVDTLTTIIAQLDATAKDALRQLLAADGALPIHTFMERYGPIRPYKPWRKDDDQGMAQPWLAPIFTTETLWYRGLLFRDPPKPQAGIYQHYVLPVDLMPHLSALLGNGATSSASPITNHQLISLARPGLPPDLMVHLGVWLASVHAAAIQPLHGRWLPPRLVAAISQRTGLDQAADFRPERSERHLPYLAFLHYLALAADLITVTPLPFN